MTTQEAVIILEKVGELAQKNGLLTLSDAVLTADAVDQLKKYHFPPIKDEGVIKQDKSPKVIKTLKK
jgi:hypothetical protein